ncbi:MAG: hypothetical protein IKU62_07390 [Ruminiclostridium sp.]|nr:hypothetical protein [Ruminiclostridium sp.]
MSAEGNKIVRAITGVTFVMVFSKLLAMVRSVLQAQEFGAGMDVDAFIQANNYTVAIFTTVAYALCVAAIPRISGALLKSREEAKRTADRLISNTMVLAILLTAVLILLGLAGLPERIFGTAQGDMFTYCFVAFSATLPVVVLTYMLLAMFQSLGHFTLQGALSLVYNLVLIGALILLAGKLSLQNFALLTAVCWLFQLAMVVPAMRKEGYVPRLRVDLREKDYWDFLRTGAITAFNAALFLLCYLVNTLFAASAPAGTVSAFFYADKLYEPLTSTLAHSVSIVLYPKFSQLYQQVTRDEYQQSVVHMMKNTLLLVLPVSVLFTAFGTPVIRVLYEGGSFTLEDGLLCGGIFSIYALGMAGFFMLDILNKAYYAMGKTMVPLCVSGCILAFCVVFDLVCVAVFPNNPTLLAFGTSLGFLLGGAVLYVFFARSGHGVKMPVKQLFWGTVLSVLLGMAAFWSHRLILADDAGKLMMVLVCMGIGVIGMLVYLLLMGSMVPTREIMDKLRGRKEG